MPRVGGELVVPSPRGGGELSGMTSQMTCLCLEMDCVPHGFRSSFRNRVEECTETPREVADAALAHNMGRARVRFDLLEQRRESIQAWADYVAG